MKEVTSLRDLLVYELRDLYSAENQLVQALPKFAEAATSPKLRKAFNEHLAATKNHVARLEECFVLLNEKPGNEICNAMQGIIAEGQKLLKEKSKFEPTVFDAALIAAAQRVEHYELAGYGSARAFCREVGETKCLQLVQQTLDEEGDTDRLLTQLALDEINPKAVAAKAATAK